MAGIRDTCTLLRHAWFVVPGDWDPPFNGTIVTMRCERCGTERREIWNERNGTLSYRRYVHTEGWVKYTADERPTLDDLRLSWIEGHITDARKRRPAKRSAANGLKAVSGG